jgi:uncharacterized protein (TIGR02466 family)
MNNQPAPREISSIFPCPVYIVKKDSELSPKEDKDIKDIIAAGMYQNLGNSTSASSYIFNSNLKEIKQFCEQQLNEYVKEIINPIEELDFYITQSWLNVTKPGEFHHNHHHNNSIISGVFYISVEEDDKIMFNDPNNKVKELIYVHSNEYNAWNSASWFFPVKNNELILFPSWLNHQVEVNEKATTDRISLSFNTFVKGTLGIRNELTELILK